MQVTTISEALQMQPDQIVMAITGIVDAVYEHKAGQNANGPWSLQNLILMDATNRNVKITAKIKDRDALPASLKGKKVYFACVKSQSGWTGVKVKDDEYRGKHKTILSITPTAEITFPDSASAPVQPPQQPQQPDAPQNTPPDDEPSQNSPQQNQKEDFKQKREDEWQESINKARVAAGQAANAYFIALKAAEFNRKRYEAEFGHALTPEHFQGMASSIFIQLCRDNYHDTLPPGDLTKYLPRKEDNKSGAAN